jgi:hypothetical protein
MDASSRFRSAREENGDCLRHRAPGHRPDRVRNVPIPKERIWSSLLRSLTVGVDRTSSTRTRPARYRSAGGRPSSFTFGTRAGLRKPMAIKNRRADGRYTAIARRREKLAVDAYHRSRRKSSFSSRA